jgi:hypothetical protein
LIFRLDECGGFYIFITKYGKNFTPLHLLHECNGIIDRASQIARLNKYSYQYEQLQVFTITLINNNKKE